MADMFDAMRRSFEASQALQSMEGVGAARKKYTEEQREIDDELARLHEQGIQTESEIARIERGAKKTSNRRFWQSLVASEGLDALVGKALEYALIAGTGGTAAPMIKAKKVYDAYKKAKKLRRGAKLLYSATKGTKAGKKELARDFEKVPTEFQFIEEEGAEFLTQERKRGREKAAGYQRSARTMKDIKESAYEGIGDVDALSAMGITQMMAGAQALSYADLAAAAGKEVVGLFGEKSVVGEQALEKVFSDVGTEGVDLPPKTLEQSFRDRIQPSLSPFADSGKALPWQEVVSQGSKLKLPELTYTPNPYTVGRDTATATLSSFFGGDKYSNTSLTGIDKLNEVLKLNQKFALKEQPRKKWNNIFSGGFNPATQDALSTIG